MSGSQVLNSESTDRRVLQALENPKFVWRTLSGLEKETQIPRKRILTTLKKLPDDTLIVSRGEGGRKVYSTRKHYKQTQSFLGKLLTGLAGTYK